ncbi:23S rRNA (uracil(1939)-C(5))-methyltransferase RlmD [Patescibacteria group bacterium]|nr:MAG: 23S rRNA (uracil(1939)-C(5))-methyltransferase RlmD [Patescibacteria group bacterium]
MKYGTPVSGTISSVSPEGPGVFEKDGRTFAVRFAVPGDQVDGTFRRRDKKTLFLDAQVTSPSSDRVTPRCPFAGRCGGCAWQQMDYPAQLEWKRRLVHQALGDHIGSPLPPVEPSPDIFYYRNRMDYVFGTDGTLGLKEPEKWWSVLDLTDCHLLSPETPRILAEVRVWAKRHGLTFWNGRSGTGLLRYLMIREGKHTGERLLNLVTSAEPLPDDAAHDLVARLSPLATSIVHGVQPKITDLSLAETFRVLHGSLELHEKLTDHAFAIHPNSFFQTNTKGAEQIVHTLRGIFGADRTEQALLDLYCGVGALGINLADRFKTVRGIEVDADAIALAQKNAAANDIGNATFEAAKVEDVVTRPGAALAEQMSTSDAVILDPPRAGLHPRVVKTLVASGPADAVYVSCNYRMLARELPEILTAYRIASIRLVDLFPHTPHVETVVHLQRTSKRGT